MNTSTPTVATDSHSHLAFDRPRGAEKERSGRARRGIPTLILLGATYVVALAAIIAAARGLPEGTSVALRVIAVLLFVVATVAAVGFFILRPNQSAVLTLFGDYKGTIRQPGLWWANPLYQKQRLSLRVRNFDTGTAKVNDANGNPVEIGAVVVWQIIDTAKAAFHVEDVVEFVDVQSEAAVRNLARQYPYDTFDDVDDDANETVTLIGNADEINRRLDAELQERLDIAGVRVIETRLTHLSYAPEIAEAMLRRQQAAAVVAARKKIVEGAVWMVRHAVEELETGDDSIHLDEERRATFASNLMTVIASDNPTSPVVNVGTLAR